MTNDLGFIIRVTKIRGWVGAFRGGGLLFGENLQRQRWPNSSFNSLLGALYLHFRTLGQWDSLFDFILTQFHWFMFLVNFFLAFKAFFFSCKIWAGWTRADPSPPLPRGFPSWNVANPGSNQVQNKIVATKSQNSQLSKKNHFRLQSFFDSNHYFLTQNLPWQSFHDTFLDNFWPIGKKFWSPEIIHLGHVKIHLPPVCLHAHCTPS